MWNPTQSSSTASSSDNNQTVREVVDVNDCECSSGVEQIYKQQQLENNSKQQTSLFGGQVLGSANIQQQDHKNGLVEEGEDITKFSDLAGEGVDSGFISGPQTSSSANLDTNKGETSADIKKLNIPATSESHYTKTQQKQEFNFDSGVIEEEYDDKECDKEGEEKNQLNESNMILPHSVDSGISEWFCNLSLQNNPNTSTISSASSVSRSNLNNLNAPKQQSSTQQINKSATYHTASSTGQQQTDTIPQQITAANAWEKYYQQNDDGDTPLHLACISGHEDVVTALIRMAPHPCLFNIQNDDAQTPLHLATLTAQPKIIRMLLIAGAKPTVRDRHGNTALHLACMSGEEQCVRALIIPISASEVNEAHRQYGYRANDKSYLKYAQLPSDLEIRNYDGERCVHLAAQAGFINILRILVLYGADINAREGKSGRTPLHIAIESCNQDLANYLLDDCQTLNLETATYAGLTAYQVACILNKSEMQNILEKRGAELLTPPDSDYDSSDIETDLDDPKLYDHFGDPGYFVGYKGGNPMTVA